MGGLFKKIKEKLRKTFLQKAYYKLRKIFGKSTHEITKKEIRSLLKKEDPIILEIGCNDGKDSKEFLKEFENLKLYCFEPDPRLIKKFKEKIKSKKCQLNEVALSNKTGKTNFYLSESIPPSKKGRDSSSIKKPKEHLNIFPWIKFDKKIVVKTDTLDNWTEKNKIEKVDFIWADVQGAEKELIEGGILTLNKKTKYFYTEFYNKELYDGQISLKKILKMLPNFKIVKIYGNNVLLKNILK